MTRSQCGPRPMMKRSGELVEQHRRVRALDQLVAEPVGGALGLHREGQRHFFLHRPGDASQQQVEARGVPLEPGDARPGDEGLDEVPFALELLRQRGVVEGAVIGERGERPSLERAGVAVVARAQRGALRVAEQPPSCATAFAELTLLVRDARVGEWVAALHEERGGAVAHVVDVDHVLLELALARPEAPAAHLVLGLTVGLALVPLVLRLDVLGAVVHRGGLEGMALDHRAEDPFAIALVPPRRCRNFRGSLRSFAHEANFLVHPAAQEISGFVPTARGRRPPPARAWRRRS